MLDLRYGSKKYLAFMGLTAKKKSNYFVSLAAIIQN